MSKKMDETDVKALTKIMKGLDFENKVVMKDIMAKYGSLMTVIGDGIISSFVKNEKTVAGIRKIYKTIKRTKFDWAIAHICNHPKTPMDVFKDIMRWGNEQHRAQLISSRVLSYEDLLEYSLLKDVSILSTIAESKHIDDKIATNIINTLKKGEPPSEYDGVWIYSNVAEALFKNPGVSAKRKASFKRLKVVKLYIAGKNELTKRNKKNKKAIEEYLAEKIDGKTLGKALEKKPRKTTKVKKKGKE